ncbi:MAG: tetratricopeptide repeat protein [Oligoflexia bacterium]|nr:tetratricopeptide repeat protein [Oligoflexia bacterium]
MTRASFKLPALMFLTWVIVFLVYLPAQHFEFLNFDDNIYVTENPHVLSGVTAENIRWALDTNLGSHWHPLSWISLMLDQTLFGPGARAPHLINILLHATNAALLMLLTFVLTSALPESLFAALLFGLHPMRMESVAWVTERKDVLSMFFMLLTLIGYAIYARRASRGAFAFSLFFYLLALLSKPSATVVPCALLLLDYWPLGRRISWKTVGEKLPYALLAGVCCWLAISSQHAGGGLKDLNAYPPLDRLASVLVGYQAYLGKFFLPTGFAIFYPFTVHQPGVAAGALVFLAAVSAVLYALRARFPALLMGWLWFIITLLPVIGIMQVGGQAFADRWTYLPHIGLIWALTFVAGKLAARRPVLCSSLAVSLLIWCAASTSVHLPDWRSSEAVFRRAALVSPDNFMAHMNLGVALDAQGKLEEAMGHYETTVLMRPFYPDGLNNLGGAHARRGEFAKAEELFKRAIAQLPGFVSAHYNLGLVYASSGRPQLAISAWLTALEIDPQYPQTLPSLRSVLAAIGAQGCGIVSEVSRQLSASNLARQIERVRGSLTPSDLDNLNTVIKCLGE